MDILRILIGLCFVVNVAGVMRPADVELPFAITSDLDQLARKGDAEALFKLGVCYQTGDSKVYDLLFTGKNPYPQDAKKAIECFEKSAKKGSTQALAWLGDVYRDGFLVKNDYKKAIGYYKEAIAKGRTGAYVNWAKVYGQLKSVLIAQGLLPETDDISADSICNALMRGYLETAAGANCADAYLELGRLDYKSDDYVAAMQNFRNALKYGSKDAWIELFNCHYHGKGCVRNKRIALEYLLDGVRNGSYPAKVTLGFMLYSGAGYEENKEAGLALLAEALLVMMENPRLGRQISQYEVLDAVVNATIRTAKIYEAEYKAQHPDWVEWLKSVTQNDAIDLSGIKLREKERKFSYGDLDVVEDCGDWYILNGLGEQVSENKYDKIEMDSLSNTLMAYLCGYGVELNGDGVEQYPMQEVLLDAFFSETVPVKRIGLCQKIICLDPYNQLGYNPMAYYNIASVYYGLGGYVAANRYMNRCISLSPDFPNAREAKTNIMAINTEFYNEKIEAKKREKTERRALIAECLLIGANALADAGAQLASTNHNVTLDKAAKEEIRRKNKEKVKAHRQKAREARMEMNRSVWQGPLSRSYTEYVGMIENAKADPVNYPKNRVEEIQRAMKQLRENADIPEHENESWGR